MQKRKKKSNFKIQKKKKICGIIVWFYLHEPRSSQTIEPLSWDPKPRLFQDLSLWATKLRFEPLSHDLLKPSSKSKSQNPSHQASKPRSDPSSRDHFKIRASKPLSRDPSHQAMIWPSQAEIEVPKTKSKPPSLWSKIRAIELRYESSWVEFYFVTKLKVSWKFTPWVWGGMLRNKFYCISHCLYVFIIIYRCPINRASHKYCKHIEKILIKM